MAKIQSPAGWAAGAFMLLSLTVAAEAQQGQGVAAPANAGTAGGARAAQPAGPSMPGQPPAAASGNQAVSSQSSAGAQQGMANQQGFVGRQAMPGQQNSGVLDRQQGMANQQGIPGQQGFGAQGGFGNQQGRGQQGAGQQGFSRMRPLADPQGFPNQNLRDQQRIRDQQAFGQQEFNSQTEPFDRGNQPAANERPDAVFGVPDTAGSYGNTYQDLSVPYGSDSYRGAGPVVNQARRYSDPAMPPFRGQEDVQSDERFYDFAAPRYRNVLEFRHGGPYPDKETDDNQPATDRQGPIGPRDRLPVWR